MLSWDNFGSAPGQNYSIYRRKFVLLLAKGFPCYALDLIALIGFADMLFWHHQSNASNTQIIRSGENQEVGVGCANRSVIKDNSKLRLIEKTLMFAKLKPL